MQNDEAKHLLEEVKKGVTEEVLEKVKSFMADRKDIFGAGEHEDGNTKKMDSKQKTAEYIRAKFAGDTSKTKALSEGTAAAGQELVPIYFANEIVRLAPKFGIVRANARKWPMGAPTVKVPTAGTVTAYRVGEKAAINSSAPSTGFVTLSAKKLACMIPVSNELLKDADVNLVDLLARLSAEALAKQEDTWGLMGTQTGEGIFQNASVPVFTLATGKTTYAQVTADDLLDTLSLLDMSAVTEAKWGMHFSVFNALRKQKANTAGVYLVQAPTDNMPANIWNEPVDFARVLPGTSAGSQNGTVFAYAADFNYMLMGDMNQYEMEISRDATIVDTDGSTSLNLFQQDMSAVRITERIDIQLAEAAKAFAVVKTSLT
jgi:HK97 family phage major capsid protein